MKVLQKQLAMAMKEMIEDTGSPLIKKMESLRQILNFSIAMCPDGNREKLENIRDDFSRLIIKDYLPNFEDPEVMLSKEELIFRMELEDLHGEVSIIINQEKLVPAYMMGDESLKRPSQQEQEEEVF